MPRVARERTKYHASSNASSALLGRPSAAATPAATHATPSPSFFAALLPATTPAPQLAKKQDIVSAPIALNTPAATTKEGPEEAGPGRKNKKEKRIERHKKWIEKLDAAQAAQRQHKKKQARAADKSALIRGMDGIQESLREVQAQVLAKDLLALEKKTTETAPNKNTAVSRKARNKAALKEEKRFGQ
ncbi:hypothetical protein LPJ61_004753, partial [Coemansia biformis]